MCYTSFCTLFIRIIRSWTSVSPSGSLVAAAHPTATTNGNEPYGTLAETRQLTTFTTKQTDARLIREGERYSDISECGGYTLNSLVSRFALNFMRFFFISIFMRLDQAGHLKCRQWINRQHNVNEQHRFEFTSNIARSLRHTRPDTHTASSIVFSVVNRVLCRSLFQFPSHRWYEQTSSTLPAIFYSL